jgi:hypothetical protein
MKCSDEVVSEVEKGTSKIGGRRRKMELCVVFAIKQGLEDKKKDGENSEDFSREVTYILETIGQVKVVRKAKRGIETTELFVL